MYTYNKFGQQPELCKIHTHNVVDVVVVVDSIRIGRTYFRVLWCICIQMYSTHNILLVHMQMYTIALISVGLFVYPVYCYTFGIVPMIANDAVEPVRCRLWRVVTRITSRGKYVCMCSKRTSASTNQACRSRVRAFMLMFTKNKKQFLSVCSQRCALNCLVVGERAIEQQVVFHLLAAVQWVSRMDEQLLDSWINILWIQ